MSDSSVTSKSPISEWDPALQAIVRCLEALDADQKAHVHHHWSGGPSRELYGGLIRKTEEFLFAERRSESWGMEALAELAISGYELPDNRHIRYLTDAAEAGRLNAQLELARMADDQRIPPPEYLEGSYEGDVVSSRWWAIFNGQEADRWWKAAAENDSALAQYRVGCELIESDKPVYFTEGVAWLKKSAHNRIPHPAAQYELAYLMELGCIDPYPDLQMFRLYESAAKDGVPEAMLAAGHYLEHGIGVAPDIKAATDWYRKAAELGRDDGYIVAYLLAGYVDDATDAAEAGYVPAMLDLAERKFNDSCTYNPWASLGYAWRVFQSGIYWYQCASDAGSLEATLALAEIYDGDSDRIPSEDWRGEFGDVEDIESALAYYQLAEKLGWSPAAKNIERIQKLLDPGNEDADPDD